MSTGRSDAARRAQARRDEEVVARDALEAVIPSAFFTDNIMNNGRFSHTTKVLLAAKAWIDSKKDAEGGEPQQNNQPDPAASTNVEPALSEADASEEIKFLHQAAVRLVQVAKDKEAEEGGGEEVKRVVNAAHDAVLDEIEKLGGRVA